MPSSKNISKSQKGKASKSYKLTDLKIGIGNWNGSIAPPLTKTHPHKCKYWSKENPNPPRAYTYGMDHVVLWQCPNNLQHKWEMKLNHFCKRKVDCQFCTVKPIEEHKRLDRRCPELANEWDFELNPPHLSPRTIKWNTDKELYWICQKNDKHRFCSNLKARSTLEEGCPFCAKPGVNRQSSLNTISPETAQAWAYKVNIGLSPMSIAADSSVVVSWLCVQGHEVRHSVRTIVKKGIVCGPCAQMKIGSNLVSLAEKDPDIAKEWHPSRNGDLKPENVPWASTMTIWWRCRANHSWRGQVTARTTAKTKCPLCTGKLTSVEKSLAALYPELAKEWHPTKNGTLKPNQVLPHSDYKAWWLCPVARDHEWQVNLRERSSKKTKCPFCGGQRVCQSNSLAALHPNVAKSWHPTLNPNLKPNQVQPYSQKRAWWKCNLNPEHEWQSTIQVRTRSHEDCPKCGPWLCLDKKQSLKSKYPALIAEWDTEKNAPIQPEHLSWGSGKKVWWRCLNNNLHKWQASVGSRTARNNGCPYCSNKKVNKSNSLRSTHPILIKEWDVERNTLSPDEITAASGIKVHWLCKKNDKHLWQASPQRRTRGGTGCPFCARKILTEESSLASLHPDLLKEWHPTKNGKLKPENLFPRSSKKIHWRCSVDKMHVWEAAISTRTAGHGCPYCSGRRVCQKKSLLKLRPDIAKQWHPTRNDNLKASDVLLFSTKSVWWKCDSGPDHEWQAQVSSRSQGQGCPCCSKRQPSITNSLAWVYPEIAKEWHPTKNGKLKPTEVMGTPDRLFWWRCSRNTRHIWKTSARTRKRGSACPKCKALLNAARHKA